MEEAKLLDRNQSQLRQNLAFGGSAGVIATVFLSLLIAFQIRDHVRYTGPGGFAEIFSQTSRVIDQAKMITLPEALRQGFKKLPDLISRTDPNRTDILALRGRNLLFPVEGMTGETIRDSFLDPRSGGRVHHAVDILAARNTPVLAVEDGTIAKLWHSKFGGITIYQYDPTGTYAYYYAHLDHYADKLREGDSVRKGQVIGYVGSTGNASRTAPHLHFALYRMPEDKKLWNGTPINPYYIYRD